MQVEVWEAMLGQRMRRRRRRSLEEPAAAAATTAAAAATTAAASVFSASACEQARRRGVLIIEKQMMTKEKVSIIALFLDASFFRMVTGPNERTPFDVPLPTDTTASKNR